MEILATLITGLFGIFTAWYTHYLKSKRPNVSTNEEDVLNEKPTPLTINQPALKSTTPAINQIFFSIGIFLAVFFIGRFGIFPLIVLLFGVSWLGLISWQKKLKIQTGCLVGVLLFIIYILFWALLSMEAERHFPGSIF